MLREAAIFFSDPAIKRGGGKGQATVKKRFFFEAKKNPNKYVATKLEGERGGGLVATKKTYY